MTIAKNDKELTNEELSWELSSKLEGQCDWDEDGDITTVNTSNLEIAVRLLLLEKPKVALEFLQSVARWHEKYNK